MFIVYGISTLLLLRSKFLSFYKANASLLITAMIGLSFPLIIRAIMRFAQAFDEWFYDQIRHKLIHYYLLIKLLTEIYQPAIFQLLILTYGFIRKKGKK